MCPHRLTLQHLERGLNEERFFAPESLPASHRPSPCYALADPLLGNTAKSVGRSPDPKFYQTARMDRFRHQRHAAFLLDYEERVGLCKHSVARTADGVGVVMSTYGEGEKAVQRASFEGLQTCGSVWHCPVCSSRISETRRGEMNKLLAWARKNGHSAFLMTLTARHGVEDHLLELLDGMKAAKKKLHQHRAYKRIKPEIIGHVTATEVTGGGRNGWHVHYHTIFIMRSEAGEDHLEELRQPWLSSLAAVGMSGGGAAFDVQDARAAGRYLAKWGAAEELSLSKHKKAKGENRTPQQLLAASCDEKDTRAGVLWSEYARTFKGRRQLVWSPGLKSMVGIDDLSDEEAAKDDLQDDQESNQISKIDNETWKSRGRRRRGLILNAAEDHGAAGVDQVIASESDDPTPDGVQIIEPVSVARSARLSEMDEALAEMNYGDDPSTEEAQTERAGSSSRVGSSHAEGATGIRSGSQGLCGEPAGSRSANRSRSVGPSGSHP